MTFRERSRSIGLGAFLLACGTSATPPQDGAPLTSVALEPIPPATASAAPSAAASASAAASVAAPAPRLPARAATPGKVQCETVDCDLATEVCCVVRESSTEYVGSCVPKPPPDPSGVTPWPCRTDADVIQRSCDEAADCPSGQRCCGAPYQESNLNSESCDTRCGEERCLAGSTCLNGNACVADAGGLAGECPRQIKPAVCAGTRCKAGEKCCWDQEAQRGACATSCEGDTFFECTGPDQCEAGHDCATWPGVVQYRCAGSGFESGVLCRTLRDCPRNLSALGVWEGAPTAKRCVHTKDLPTGVKGCVYE